MSEIEQAREKILELLDERVPGKTICPSDAARALDEGSFRRLMPTVRAAAGELARDGAIEVTQRGSVVDLETVRGPVRLGLTDPDR